MIYSIGTNGVTTIKESKMTYIPRQQHIKVVSAKLDTLEDTLNKMSSDDYCIGDIHYQADGKGIMTIIIIAYKP